MSLYAGSRAGWECVVEDDAFACCQGNATVGDGDGFTHQQSLASRSLRVRGNTEVHVTGFRAKGVWGTLSLAIYLPVVVWACGHNGASAATGAGGAGGSKSEVCTPGLTQACVGLGACEGGQVCKADGSGWGPCNCGAASSTSSGSGAGGAGGAGGVGGVGGMGGAGGVGGAGGAGGAVTCVGEDCMEGPCCPGTFCDMMTFECAIDGTTSSSSGVLCPNPGGFCGNSCDTGCAEACAQNRLLVLRGERRRTVLLTGRRRDAVEGDGLGGVGLRGGVAVRPGLALHGAELTSAAAGTPPCTP